MKRVLLLLFIFIGSAMALQAQTPLLTRGPYLQKLTSRSVVVKWQTLLPGSAEVKFGLNANALDQSVTDETSSATHVLTLSNLQPATRYYYAIFVNGAMLQGDDQNYFLTAPVAGTAGDYSFWVIGDCGNNSTNQKQVLDSYLAYRGERPTNAWITLGDNAYLGGLDLEFKVGFFDIYQGSVTRNSPLFPAPGNHDYNNLPINQWFKQVPYYEIFDLPSQGESGGEPSNTEAFYAFDYGNVHFLSLDSYGEEELQFRLFDTLGPQAQWIKRDLEKNQLPWVVAYWHHPPFSMASHNSDTEGELVDMREQFLPFLERLGVDLVFCGHSHGYERSRPMKGHYGMESTFDPAIHNVDQSSGRYDGSENSCTYVKQRGNAEDGTIYIVAGSSGQLGGSQLTYPHDAMYFSDVDNGGSFVIDVKDNRLDGSFLCADGVIRDQFTIVKDANRRQQILALPGELVTLTASWPGDYLWSTGDTTRSIVVRAEDTKTYSVSDRFQCLEDRYEVKASGVGINKNTASRGLKLAPNPAIGEVALEYNGQVAINGWRITDITGRLVKHDFFQPSLTYKERISLNKLHSGIYLITLTGASGAVETQKLEIQ